MTSGFKEDINLLFSSQGTTQGKPSFFRAIGIILFKAGVHAVLFYRFYHFLYRKSLRMVAEFLARLNYFLTGAEIDPAAEIGGGFRLFHPSGVVIGRGAKIGKNVSLKQGVVLEGGGSGIISPGENLEDSYPTVEDGVWIFAGAKILGPIKIGENAIIGANTVVNESVPPRAVVLGTTNPYSQKEIDSLKEIIVSLQRGMLKIKERLQQL